jgi:hypothetical protein
MSKRSPVPRPVFSCSSHPELGDNINGPCVIRVPEWVGGAPGRYLMYFAHHLGDYIRLAYADSPLGPWSLHEGGCLGLAQVPGLSGHIASPDAVVLDEEREIRLYFHGYGQGAAIRPDQVSQGQVTLCARSRDGIHFKPENVELGPYYMRVFSRGGVWYAIAKNHYDGNILLRSSDGLSAFERGPALIPRSRHVGLEKDREGRLWVYCSRIGDAPERILKAELIMAGDWKSWRCAEPLEVKAPEYDWEGVDCPRLPSKKGVVHERAWQLRDPYVLSDRDGGRYLYYSFAGEKGIAVLEL